MGVSGRPGLDVDCSDIPSGGSLSAGSVIVYKHFSLLSVRFSDVRGRSRSATDWLVEIVLCFKTAFDTLFGK